MINLVTREVKRSLTDDLGWPDDKERHAKTMGDIDRIIAIVKSQ